MLLRSSKRLGTMKTKISDLPRDLTEEVFSKLPLTSLRRVRSTCKNWNNISKDRSFAKKHIGNKAKLAASERDFMVVLIMEFRVYLMSINLDNNNDVKSCIKKAHSKKKKKESCIKPQAKLISLDDEVDDVYQVFHCDGLLLCITEDDNRLTVWNPYTGQIRRIEPTHNFDILDRYHRYSYALGYDKRSKSYKILRFIDYSRYTEYKIYEFNSDSWRVLDITPRHWGVSIFTYLDDGVSLKGNTYWFTNLKKYPLTSVLVCFDFTSETFGPPLPLPFELYVASPESLSLSSVREEQLVLLRHLRITLSMEIWVTTNIEPNAVSWNRKVLLTANIQPQFYYDEFTHWSFFIDEAKKVAVVFGKGKVIKMRTPNNKAYIFGEDGSFKKVDLGECAVKGMCYPRVCCYVPSLVQINDTLMSVNENVDHLQIHVRGPSKLSGDSSGGVG